MDVQIIESINGGIKMTNDRVLPVLSAITGMDSGADRDKWEAGGSASSDGSQAWACDNNAQRRRQDPRHLGPRSVASASRPVPWFIRSKARGRSRRSTWTTGCWRKDSDSGKLSFQPVVAIRGRGVCPDPQGEGGR